MCSQQLHPDHHSQGRPPFFRSWRGFYLAVILWLLLLIVFFYLFTKYFS